MLKKLETFLQESTNISSNPKISVEENKSSNDIKYPVNINNAREKISKAINESTDLISALECVGAMYGIPASNIISDNSINGIRVQDDTIIAPRIPNPASQSKPIMQAIGTVLDYISQRIDDKLDEYQMNNIRDGHDKEVLANANPNKGKCVGLYKDDEGGEILAYDTGLVDSPHTPAAMAKIKELRDTNQIPAFDPSANRPSGISGLSYFTDEDDITSDVDMSASSSTEPVPDEADNMPVNDVSDQIQESAYHINMINKFNGTTHLGYDLLTKQGFDFIKPSDSIIIEADTSKAADKNLKIEDIKHMKFDNTEILKAVECFNKARTEQNTVANGKINLRDFVRDKNFSEGITHLEKQFDCHISLKFVKHSGYIGDNVSTDIINDIKQKVTVSKSKGFQLGGMSISITHFHRFFELNTPDDNIEIFGQRMVAVLCHEIFHNIASALRYEATRNTLSLIATMQLAAAAKTPKEKRIILTNYVESLDKMYDSKILDKIAKKKLVKKLLIASSLYSDSELKKAKKIFSKKESSDKSADDYIDDLIKKARRVNNKTNFGKPLYHIRNLVYNALALLIASFIFNEPTIVGLFITIDIISFFVEGASYFSKKKQNKTKNPKNPNFEEYYCDLFAAMYQLPITWFTGFAFGGKEKFSPNNFDQSKLNKYAMLEREIFDSLNANYPTDSERTHAGVTAAKTILKDPNIDESTKKYCQWIVDNFSDIHTTDIDLIYNVRYFDPKEVENLDEHLAKLIKDNGIPITESFIRWMYDDKIIQ